MKFIHTADWHLGKHLYRQDRTEEIARALDQLLTVAKAETVDAVIVAGDVFDTPSPSPAAFRVAFRFFRELADSGISAVVIAGNHDSGDWFDGAAEFFSLAGIYMLGRPRNASRGGLRQLTTRRGEKLCLATVPFASARRILRYLEIWERSATEQQGVYREAMEYLMKNLTSSFIPDAVNVLVAHTMVAGAVLSGSEAKRHSVESYELSGQSLDASAQYIALGHVHKPQHLTTNPLARYSGSLIQVDFGEEGEDKFFNLIEVEPGLPAKVRQIPLAIERPLKVVRCEQAELDGQIEAHRQHPGWLRFDVLLENPMPNIKEYVQKELENVLHVNAGFRRTVEPGQSEGRPLEEWLADPVQSLSEYYRQKKQRDVTPEVIEAFQGLYQQFSQ